MACREVGMNRPITSDLKSSERASRDQRRRLPNTTREKVLLRCFFQCTWPGCTRLAADLHHVVLRSDGGSDEETNLIGLCKPCHRSLHSENKPIVFVDDRGWMKPIDAAALWLFRQLEECPTRLDPARRSVLFDEVEAAVTSIENMNHHAQAIYDSNHWCSYEVFLKAAWSYLGQRDMERSAVGAILLLKMAQFYRRRPGRVYQRAAVEKMHEFRELIAANNSSHQVRWLDGIATYEEAYMKFLIAPSASTTEDVFKKSVALEIRYGRPVGEYVSLAQSHVVTIRRATTANLNLERTFSELSAIQDNLSAIGGPTAEKWARTNIPIQLAHIDLIRGQYSAVIDSLTPLAKDGESSAFWYRGIAMLRMGGFEEGICDLEQARRQFYSEQRTEGRGALLVALGDARRIVGREEDAKASYSEALRQPVHMDNFDAVNVAKNRLSERRGVISTPSDVYLN